MSDEILVNSDFLDITRYLIGEVEGFHKTLVGFRGDIQTSKTQIANAIAMFDNKLSEFSDRLIQLERQVINQAEKQAQIPTVPPNNPQQRLPILDLPIAMLVTLFNEAPQVLYAYSEIVALDSRALLNESLEQVSLKPMVTGNYWVVCLGGDEYYLLPNIETFRRMTRQGLRYLFDFQDEGEQVISSLTLLRPAQVAYSPTDNEWLVKERGAISLNESSLHFKWQDNIETMKKQMLMLTNIIERLQSQIKTLKENS